MGRREGEVIPIPATIRSNKVTDQTVFFLSIEGTEPFFFHSRTLNAQTLSLFEYPLILSLPAKGFLILPSEILSFTVKSLPLLLYDEEKERTGI